MSRRALHSLVGVAAAVVAIGVGTAVAGAPVINNGGFETNDLTGWRVDNQEAGLWLTYKGHFEGMPAPKRGEDFGPFPKPPRGTYAAVSDQGDPSTMIISQVFKVPPKATLQFFTYYQSDAPFATPHDLNGDTDNHINHPNEQYRVDLVKPDAPIRSLDGGDLLKSLFRTRTEDPLELRPTKISASLKRFAGEKVRLRFAVSVNENVLNAGVDGVKVKTAK